MTNGNTTQQTNLKYDEELKQMTEESKKNFDEVFPPSWKPPIGTTIGTFLSDERKNQLDKQNKMKKILRVGLEGIEHSWWVNPANPIYKQIVEEGVKRKSLIGVRFSLTRVGEGTNTRYDLKFL